MTDFAIFSKDSSFTPESPAKQHSTFSKAFSFCSFNLLIILAISYSNCCLKIVVGLLDSPTTFASTWPDSSERTATVEVPPPSIPKIIGI